ncbi:MAG: DUF4157 domain-containing protein [Leptolyngbya sp. SIO4C5]|nr:DUF4157 domain-containing protein [Leptolyngbya sp. SIO4C5]
MHTKVTAPVLSSPSTTASGQLQRQCACAASQRRCDRCQPKQASIPPIVHEVLRSPGQSLPERDRAEMEASLGADFSQVRLHTDSKAQQSAESVNALAYTAGPHIVFGAGQFSAGNASRQLLAHELVHVMQQRGSALPERISEAGDRSEQEADRIAQNLTAPSPPTVIQRGESRLRRKLQVDRPAEPIPTPDQAGRQPTNAETVEGYLRTLSSGGNPSVDRGSGEVSLDTAFCPGFLGGLVQGARAGYDIGNTIGSIGGRIPLFGPILGAIGGLFGAIGGAIAGLFGAQSPSPAAASDTSTGSTCLCDFVDARPVWTIEVNDGPDSPITLDNNRVRVPSPNSPQVVGAATVSGRLETIDPWLALGHELCGHAWLELQGESEAGAATEAPLALRDETGAVQLAGPDPQADQFLRHQRTVERENLLRQEHGLEARGFRLRDPYCGESFRRDRGEPTDQRQWQRGIRGSGFDTYLETCEYLRRQLPENQDGRYRIDQRIPE